MISKEASIFFAKIADNIKKSGFIVKEWDEIKAVYGENVPKDEQIAEMWEQIKFYGYIDQKYKDESEVCFAITDKGRLFEEELKIVVDDLDAENVDIKTDKYGRPVAVVPTSIFKKIGVFFKAKWVNIVISLTCGFVGGIVGGVIMLLK